MTRNATAFDPATTYIHAADGGDAAHIPVTPTFWDELMSDAPRSDDAKRVATEGGWLFASFRVEEDTTTWEMHPEGDEILFLLSGAIDIVFETKDGEQVTQLTAGKACVVPKGVWHKHVVVSPGDELALTYGRGTQHKPV